RNYGIKPDQLRKVVKSAMNICHNEGVQFTKPTFSKGLISRNDELAIVNWVLTVSNCGFTVTRKDVALQIKKVLKGTSLVDMRDNIIPKDWIRKFIQRYPDLKPYVKDANDSADRTVSPEECINLWYNKLAFHYHEPTQTYIGNLLNNNSSSRVFNAEEMFVFFRDSNTLCNRIVLKSERGMQKKDGGLQKVVTVLVCCNANGLFLKPLIISPSKTQICTSAKDISDASTAYYNVNYSQFGFVNPPLFVKWLKNFNDILVKESIQKPVVLLLNGSKVNYVTAPICKWANANGIIIFGIPHNISSVLAPLEVGVIGSLKAEFLRSAKSFDPPHEELYKSADSGLCINIKHFPSIFMNAWNKVANSTSAKKGFKETGILPRSNSAISNEKIHKIKPKISKSTKDISPEKQKEVQEDLNSAVEAVMSGMDRKEAATLFDVSYDALSVKLNKEFGDPWENGRYEEAIEAIQSGMDISEATKRYIVSKQKITFLVNMSNPFYVKGKGSMLHWGYIKVDERGMIKWVMGMNRRGFVISKYQIRANVKHFLESSSQKDISNLVCDKVATSSWLNKFIKKHHQLTLLYYEPEKLDTADNDRDRINKWYSELEDHLKQEELDPEEFFSWENSHRVFNACEIGIPLASCNETDKSNILKRVRSVQKRDPPEHTMISVMVCCSASGLYQKPMIIFPSKVGPTTPQWNKTEGIDESTFNVQCNSYGCLDPYLFSIWLKEFNETLIQSDIQKPVLLLLEGDTSLDYTVCELARSMGIILHGIIPRTAQILLPLGISYLQQLNASYTKQMEKISHTIDSRRENSIISNFPCLFMHGFKEKSTTVNAIYGFRATGILPRNNFAITDDALHSISDEKDTPVSSTSVTSSSPSIPRSVMQKDDVTIGEPWEDGRMKDAVSAVQSGMRLLKAARKFRISKNTIKEVMESMTILESYKSAKSIEENYLVSSEEHSEKHTSCYTFNENVQKDNIFTSTMDETLRTEQKDGVTKYCLSSDSNVSPSVDSSYSCIEECTTDSSIPQSPQDGNKSIENNNLEDILGQKDKDQSEKLVSIEGADSIKNIPENESDLDAKNDIDNNISNDKSVIHTNSLLQRINEDWDDEVAEDSDENIDVLSVDKEAVIINENLSNNNSKNGNECDITSTKKKLHEEENSENKIEKSTDEQAKRKEMHVSISEEDISVSRTDNTDMINKEKSESISLKQDLGVKEKALLFYNKEGATGECAQGTEKSIKVFSKIETLEELSHFDHENVSKEITITQENRNIPPENDSNIIEDKNSALIKGTPKDGISITKENSFVNLAEKEDIDYSQVTETVSHKKYIPLSGNNSTDMNKCNVQFRKKSTRSTRLDSKTPLNTENKDNNTEVTSEELTVSSHINDSKDHIPEPNVKSKRRGRSYQKKIEISGPKEEKLATQLSMCIPNMSTTNNSKTEGNGSRVEIVAHKKEKTLSKKDIPLNETSSQMLERISSKEISNNSNIDDSMILSTKLKSGDPNSRIFENNQTSKDELNLGNVKPKRGRPSSKKLAMDNTTDVKNIDKLHEKLDISKDLKIDEKAENPISINFESNPISKDEINSTNVKSKRGRPSKKVAKDNTTDNKKIVNQLGILDVSKDMKMDEKSGEPSYRNIENNPTSTDDINLEKVKPKRGRPSSKKPAMDNTPNVKNIDIQHEKLDVSKDLKIDEIEGNPNSRHFENNPTSMVEISLENKKPKRGRPSSKKPANNTDVKNIDSQHGKLNVSNDLKFDEIAGLPNSRNFENNQTSKDKINLENEKPKRGRPSSKKLSMDNISDVKNIDNQRGKLYVSTDLKFDEIAALPNSKNFENDSTSKDKINLEIEKTKRSCPSSKELAMDSTTNIQNVDNLHRKIDVSKDLMFDEIAALPNSKNFENDSTSRGKLNVENDKPKSELPSSNKLAMDNITDVKKNYDQHGKLDVSKDLKYGELPGHLNSRNFENIPSSKDEISLENEKAKEGCPSSKEPAMDNTTDIQNIDNQHGKIEVSKDLKFDEIAALPNSRNFKNNSTSKDEINLENEKTKRGYPPTNELAMDITTDVQNSDNHQGLIDVNKDLKIDEIAGDTNSRNLENNPTSKDDIILENEKPKRGRPSSKDLTMHNTTENTVDVKMYDNQHGKLVLASKELQIDEKLNEEIKYKSEGDGTQCDEKLGKVKSKRGRPFSKNLSMDSTTAINKPNNQHDKLNVDSKDLKINEKSIEEIKYIGDDGNNKVKQVIEQVIKKFTVSSIDTMRVDPIPKDNKRSSKRKLPELDKDELNVSNTESPPLDFKPPPSKRRKSSSKPINLTEEILPSTSDENIDKTKPKKSNKKNSSKTIKATEDVLPSTSGVNIEKTKRKKSNERKSSKTIKAMEDLPSTSGEIIEKKVQKKSREKKSSKTITATEEVLPSTSGEIIKKKKQKSSSEKKSSKILQGTKEALTSNSGKNIEKKPRKKSSLVIKENKQKTKQTKGKQNKEKCKNIKKKTSKKATVNLKKCKQISTLTKVKQHKDKSKERGSKTKHKPLFLPTEYDAPSIIDSVASIIDPVCIFTDPVSSITDPVSSITDPVSSITDPVSIITDLNPSILNSPPSSQSPPSPDVPQVSREAIMRYLGMIS
ncbi:unnamed protein product, partial [Meganyctiphanes norvegica]